MAAEILKTASCASNPEFLARHFGMPMMASANAMTPILALPMVFSASLMSSL